jgi:hypothetical protein
MLVRQEEDLLATRQILAVMAVLVVSCVICGVWAWWLLRVHETAIRPDRRFPEQHLPAPTEMNGVEQALFVDLSESAITQRADARVLETFGAATNGRIRIPIADAIDLYLAGVKPGPRSEP